MKKLNNIACLLVSILLLIAGCTDAIPSAKKGTVIFSIGNSISKGIDSNISMDVDHYTIYGAGPNNNTFTARIEASESSYTQENIYIGNWTFTATAYNADDIAIGSGSASTTVKPGNNTVSILINETEGQGTLKVIIEGVLFDDTYTLRLYTAEGGPVSIQNIDFEESNGTLSVEKLLDNGFYAFDIISTNSLVKIPALDSVRIVKGDTVTVTYTIIDSGNVSVSIKNEIIPTPSLSLSLSSDTISSGETVTATVAASNIDTENIQYLWLIDNEMVAQTSSSSYVFDYEAIRAGEHDITCILIENVNGIAWSDTATITGSAESIEPAAPAYLSITEDGAVSCTDTTVTKVVIPETINGHKVKSIAESGFEGCSQLTSVTIPNGVTSIDNYAFWNCSSLTEITIPNSVSSIGDGAFGGCTLLDNISLPNSINSIGDSAFSGCDALSEITIPESVTIISGGMFQGCTSLTRLTIPINVTLIEASAFKNCTSLADLNIPASVTTIEDGAFSGTAITEIIIPESVTSVGIGAFKECSQLTSVTIPDSVTSIGAYVFYGCSALEDVTLGSGITTLDGGTTGKGFFEGCTSLTEITIPDGVTTIGHRAFWNCSKLTKITIPESVTSVGQGVFNNCSSLQTINIDQEKDSLYFEPTAYVPSTATIYWRGEY